MSIVLPLDEEQRDALQELLNISMGQAANSLAQLIETKIDISIPKISAVTINLKTWKQIDYFSINTYFSKPFLKGTLK